MAIKVMRGNGTAKGSFANANKNVTAPVKMPAAPSRSVRQY